ncbi:hypothetical protein [Actinoallomurus sp. CA-150999]
MMPGPDGRMPHWWDALAAEAMPVGPLRLAGRRPPDTTLRSWRPT